MRRDQPGRGDCRMQWRIYSETFQRVRIWHPDFETRDSGPCLNAMKPSMLAMRARSPREGNPPMILNGLAGIGTFAWGFEGKFEEHCVMRRRFHHREMIAQYLQRSSDPPFLGGDLGQKHILPRDQ